MTWTSNICEEDIWNAIQGHALVKALANKRSETIQDAMVDMQLLLRGVRQFHSDERREFMGAIDNWLTQHTVLHTANGAYDPNADSLVEESGVGNVVFYVVNVPIAQIIKTINCRGSRNCSPGVDFFLGPRKRRFLRGHSP